MSAEPIDRGAAAEGARLEVAWEPGPDGLIVRVTGEVDAASTAELRVALDRALATGADTVRLDLSGVPFLDSTGIGALVGARNRARSRGTRLEVARLSPPVRKVFEITHLADVLPVG